jgi:hypothetical protein
MKRFSITAIVAVAVCFLASTSQAGFIITVAQSGANVTMTYSGSLSFVGSGSIAPHTPNNWIQNDEFYRITDVPNSTETQFSGSRIPNLVLFPNWTSPRLFADSATGDKIGILDDGRVVTAQYGTGMWSGQTYSASGTMTFNNKLVSNFINVGETRVVTWTQTGQNFIPGNTVTIVGVPEPSSIAVTSGLVAGLSVLSRRRRQA